MDEHDEQKRAAQALSESVKNKANDNIEIPQSEADQAVFYKVALATVVTILAWVYLDHQEKEHPNAAWIKAVVEVVRLIVSILILHLFYDVLAKRNEERRLIKRISGIFAPAHTRIDNMADDFKTLVNLTTSTLQLEPKDLAKVWKKMAGKHKKLTIVGKFDASVLKAIEERIGENDLDVNIYTSLNSADVQLADHILELTRRFGDRVTLYHVEQFGLGGMIIGETPGCEALIDFSSPGDNISAAYHVEGAAARTLLDSFTSRVAKLISSKDKTVAKPILIDSDLEAGFIRNNRDEYLDKLTHVHEREGILIKGNVAICNEMIETLQHAQQSLDVTHKVTRDINEMDDKEIDAIKVLGSGPFQPWLKANFNAACGRLAGGKVRRVFIIVDENALESLKPVMESMYENQIDVRYLLTTKSEAATLSDFSIYDKKDLIYIPVEKWDLKRSEAWHTRNPEKLKKYQTEFEAVYQRAKAFCSKQVSA
jgi:hypothetical protein